MDTITWRENPFRDPKPTAHLTPFTPVVAERVLRYHRSWPRYQKTPLWHLEELALSLGVGTVWVKDESYRWGLKAFKGLGGTHAVGRCLARELGLAEVPPYSALATLTQDRAPLTFATATDGNHGVGVAWAASQLRQHARIYMPRGAADARLQAVASAGGEVHRSDLNYDDLVEWVAEEARKQGWMLVQDTAWYGYEEIPTWIMQGYLTLMAEEFQRAEGGVSPTHVFLQAGVGSYAAAVTAFLANHWGTAIPRIVLMEPHSAACFFQAAQRGEGTLQAAGPIRTVMAGLACGVGNPAAWEILRRWVSVFVACNDAVTERGMRILAHPLGSDPAVASGESGAVGMGVLSSMAQDNRYRDLRAALDLNQDSRVLLISTEGATDPVMYRRIVHAGFTPPGAS